MGASDWITLAATTIAAASFVWGVVSWRASYLGQRKIELAEQVYELALNCFDHVRAIRSPIGHMGEGSTRARGENERAEESEIYDRAFVALERMDARKEDFNKLFSQMPRFEFYFGEEYTKSIREFRSVLSEIQVASLMLRHYWVRQGQHFRTEAEFQNHLERMRASEAVFWEGYGENDPINPRLDLAVTNIKEACKTAIEPKVNIWWILKDILHRIDEFVRIPPDIRR